MAAEQKDPNSILNWYRRLITLRREIPALRNGGMVMVDTTNPRVLSYVRTAPAGAKAVVVSVNMTGQPQKIALDLGPAGIKQKAVKTLLTNEPSLQGATTTTMTLPPFASWVGEVR